MSPLNFIAVLRRLVLPLALFCPILVTAQDGGYFSGVRLGTSNKVWSFAAPGLKLGQALEYSRSNNGADRANTAFSGYQFESGFAVGAALSSEPLPPTVIGAGVGLRFDGLRWSDSRSNLNVDVVSAFNWRNSLSVFGKLGVGRTDNRGSPDSNAGGIGPPERPAISYGIGVRYDLTPSLGLKLELSRGSRFGTDRAHTDVDIDAVNFGIRWTF